MRRTSVAGLIGVVYGICTGVILAAYHEFGGASVLKPPRFVAAGLPPAELPPRKSIPDERTAAAGPARQAAPLTVVADTVPLTSPAGSAPVSPTADEIRPAMALWPDGQPVDDVAALMEPEALDSARDAAGPHPSGDTPPQERSVATASDVALDSDAAVAPQVTSVVAQEPLPQATTVAAPRPTFRPLDALTTVVAEVGLPAALGAPEAPRSAVSRSQPPRPLFKPVILTNARPEPARAPSPPAVAATAQTLPEALRAFWVNLKILLASAPASSDRRAERDSNGGGAASVLGSPRSTARSGSPGGGGGNSSSDSGGNSSPGDSEGNSSANAGGSGASAGGGSGAGGGGSASGSGGGGSGAGGGGSASGSGGGSSASSGDDRGSVSSGGDRGRGRGDRDRGGRGGRDRDGDRSSRGDDRGGRGDGGRGGRGNGRGGGDDDD